MTKISQLSSIGDSLAIGDQFLIRDIDDTGSPNKSVTVSGITRALDTGTAAAPAIAFATDKNTGIYSPGADQVAISTNGTKKFHVDAIGQIGIGLNPSRSLDVYKGDAAGRAILRLLDVDSRNVELRSPDGLGNQAGVGTVTNQDFVGFTSNTERLCITSGGLVGIGTSSPLTKLEVRSGVITAGSTDATSGAEILRGYYGSNGALAVIGSEYSSGGIVIGCAVKPSTSVDSAFLSSASGALPRGAYTIAGNIHKWYIGAIQTVAENSSVSTSEVMRIDSSGRVGIGTSSPANKITAAGAEVGIGIYNTTTGTTASPSFCKLNFYGYLEESIGNVASISAGNSATNTYGGTLRFATNTEGGTHTTALTIDNQQRVGIGTTSPATALHVSTNQSTVSTFQTSGADLYLRFQNSVSTGGYVGYNGSALTLWTTDTERARLDSSGRLLVGTSSARLYTSLGYAKFQLEGTSFADSSIGLTNNQATVDGAYLVFNKTRGTAIGSVTSVQSGDLLGSIWFQGTDGTSPIRGATIEAAVDGTPGANDMPGRLVFSTTADGAATSTERMRISNNGALRAFSANTVVRAFSATGAGTVEYLFSGSHSSTDVAGSGSTLSFVVLTNGNVQNTNNSYTAISDIKLKENVVDANSQWSDIKALQVRNYNLKEGQIHRQIGLIAQEVEPISPGLVYESPDRDAEGNDLGTVTKSVNYSVLYMKAVKALQEAMERIETLEARLTAAGIE